RHEARRAADAGARRRGDHQHRLDRRHAGRLGPDGLFRGQGRGAAQEQGGRRAALTPEDPRQRHLPRSHRHLHLRRLDGPAARGRRPDGRPGGRVRRHRAVGAQGRPAVRYRRGRALPRLRRRRLRLGDPHRRRRRHHRRQPPRLGSGPALALHPHAGAGDDAPTGLVSAASALAAKLTPNVHGALWMVASALGFTAMTTLIKYLGDDYSAPLQTFYRQVAGFVVLLPIIIQRRGAAFATTRPGILIFRASAGTLGMILSFYAFQKMPLADANALSFTRTLWMVPLAALVLHETAGPLRIGAAIVGFIGVLIMLLPGMNGQFAIGWPALAMLASSFLFALTITGMKVMTRDHSPM